VFIPIDTFNMGINMAPIKVTNRLSALDVTRKKVGMHLDGAGLYLQVTERGRSWIFRYKSPVTGRTRDMGIGPTHTFSLARARELAMVARGQVKLGIDPIEARKAERKAAKLEAAKAIKFEDAAAQFIKAHKAGWRSPKSEAQWKASLKTHAYPVIGNLAVADIGVAEIMRVLDPIWTEKTETASRVRGRIERILDWATVRGYRQGDNPARWRESLKTQLAARADVQTVTHFPALPYAEIGAFMDTVRARDGIAAKALEYTILTAARTGEVIGATWPEFDLTNAVWIIPAERMKVREEHRVPLSPPALAIIKAMQDAGGDYVFPGGRRGKPLSNMAMLTLLKRMGRDDITTHGFRSSFTDWAMEQTNYANEIRESALAHTISNAVERAYRRGDLFDKRRRLMNDWAKYCNTVAAKRGDKVVAIRG
jgi:integrase